MEVEQVGYGHDQHRIGKKKPRFAGLFCSNGNCPKPNAAPAFELRLGREWVVNRFMPQRILFTGGSGKAGRHVLPWLASRGYSLLNFDLKPSEHPSIPTLLGDMTDEGQVFNAMTTHFGFAGFHQGQPPAPVDAGVATFKDARHVILIGAKVPAPMFGYPGKPDYLMQPGANLIELAAPTDDLHETLRELAARLKALDAVPLLEAQKELALPQGVLTAEAVLRTISALMPENAIIVDESISAGRSFFPVSMGTPAHDYLQLTGGSIGSGLPMATGAAIACPGRTVINMEGDGSSMYTIQALWTQAREKLNVVTVIFANRGYQILKGELVSVGAASWGERAERMLSIVEPDISWVKLAEGMGVEARAATTCEELAQLIRHAVSRPGPFLIEAQIGR